MLHLVFRVHRDRYLLPVTDLVEVLPLVEWTAIAGAPPGVAGVFSYHGEPVPLLDLGQALFGAPTPGLRGTRILLVRYPAPTGDARLLGLLVEEATRFLRRTPEELEPSPVASGSPALGPLAHDGPDLLQRVELTSLVPADLWERLLAPAGAEAR